MNENSHHNQSFWQKYIFSTDHKVIGIQYGITALLFLFFGFSLMMVMRWQLAYPDTAVPIVGGLVKWLATLNGFASNGNLPSEDIWRDCNCVNHIGIVVPIRINTPAAPR